MAVYCLEDFKKEFERIKGKSSYKSLEKDIIDYFIGKPISELVSGTRLNGSNENPYIKKRVKGRGGWRFYYLAVVKNGCIYLMFFHPKTGSEGIDNINDDLKASLYKKVLECMVSEDYYSLETDTENKKLIFKHRSEKKSTDQAIAYKTVDVKTDI